MLSNSRSVLLRAVFASATATVVVARAHAQACFHSLGSDTAMAFDISSETGAVVGYGRIGLTAARQAFAWSPTSGVANLGGNDPWYRSTVATGITCRGDVVVGQDGSEAFRWSSSGGRTLLGVPDGSAQSAATGVSADGSVIVGSGYDPDTDRGQAFRWTAGRIEALGTLKGHDSSFATGVSDRGDVVVGYSRGLASEAFRWTEAGGMVGLGSLAGAGENYSYAQAISADGATIVGLSASADGYEAFRWTEAGGMVGLGASPSGASTATGVTADGRVVIGNLLWAEGGEDAFVWTEGAGMRTLVDLLTRDYGLADALDGWSSLGAYALSSDGRYIGGTGYHNGTKEAWVLDRGARGPGGFVPVPEASTFGGLAGAALGLGVAYRVYRRRART